jgi:hypothetical protein
MKSGSVRPLILLAFTAMSSACSSHMYHSEAKVYAEAVTDELIRLGVCTSKLSCSENQIVLWEGGGWSLGSSHAGGVTIEVYRVADASVAAALVDRCRELHSRDSEVPVSIVIHSNAHIDNLHPGKPVIVRRARFS